MISPEDFVEGLKKQGFTSFTGVPCSFFQSAINRVIDDPQLRYTIVPNEGLALSLAAGASLTGNRSVVMIQNSGFGNLINPLTSLNMIYKIPVLLFISGRAYGVPDEPQHQIVGKNMGAILDTLGIPHVDLPDDRERFETALLEAVHWMEKEKLPYSFFVKKGTLASYRSERKGVPRYPLKRMEAIKLLSEVLEGEECIIATTGKPSRELFSLCDRKNNFYMQGSMGHASAMGLGIALHRPAQKIVILDGDGALLMHMGILSAIGHYQPKNLFHIVLDNESYESTGDQDTTSPTTDFCKIAKACGYRAAEEGAEPEELKNQMKRILKGEGPAFLRVKINRLPTADIPRITTKYTSEKIAENFKDFVAGRRS